MLDSVDGRLDSWKEIADYLRRDIRTVTRWEKEKGLPVHTLPGGKRRTVCAYKHEIEAWLGNSASELEVADELPAGALERLGQLKARIPLVVWVGLGLLVLALAGFTAYLVRANQSPALAALLQQGNRLVAISPNGSVAWTHDFPFESTITQSTVVQRGDGKSAAGVLVSIYAGEMRGDSLYFLSTRGQPLWPFQPRDTTAFRAGEYSLQRGFDTAQAFRWGGQTRIAVAVHHTTWWPSQLLVLDLQGRVLDRFVNSGWIRQVVFMEGAKGPLLLLGGISNSGDGGMVAVLDANRVSGASPEEAGSPYECTNCPPGRPLKYFVFPRSELNRVTGSGLVGVGVSRAGATIFAGNSEVHASMEPETGNPAATYEFSPEFELLRAQYTDRYWEYHRQLELEGRLKHSRAHCPERNGPSLVRMWDPQHGWTDLHPNQK